MYVHYHGCAGMSSPVFGARDRVWGRALWGREHGMLVIEPTADRAGVDGPRIPDGAGSAFDARHVPGGVARGQHVEHRHAALRRGGVLAEASSRGRSWTVTAPRPRS